jgi:IS1 family transposase
MYVSKGKAAFALQLLIEGNSIRSTMRLTGLDQNTITKLLILAGEKCEKLMGRLIVNVPVRDVECDEIWAYVGKKEGHKLPEEANDNTIGDAYCFVVIERHSKLVLNFALGRRDQVTTDGFTPYRSAITTTLCDRVDFAQLIKVYRAPVGGEARYSPAEVASTEVVLVQGRPDPERICTSIVERQNLTIRMQMRRLTRLTNAFSKKWENLWAAYCLHFAYYNFCRIHKSLRVTPAMEAGITDHVWEISDLLDFEIPPIRIH